ncbi:hypothetical protein [Devosia sp.]|uniref:hypothetical protein n=1 Tax=Devosia sp. TaxID=1871048 RepID=UPI003F72613C
MHAAQAQVLTPGANGYYYSVTGGLMFSSSERYLTEIEDKVGAQPLGYSSDSNSSYVASGGSSFYSSASWSHYGSSYSSGLSDFKGFFGSVSFGKQLDPNWDVRGTVSVVNGGTTSGYASAHSTNTSETYTSSFYYGSSNWSSSYSSSYNRTWASGKYSFGYLAADLEVGYTPVLSDTFSVRLFAGLRAMSFKSSFEGSAGDFYANYNSYSNSSYNGSSHYAEGWNSNSGGSYFSGLAEVKFTGIGPRVGIQGATRFEGTNFGLSGSVATSVLFGKKKVTTTGYHSSWSEYSYSSYDSFFGSNQSGSSSSFASSGTFSTESNATVVDLQASAGLDYYLNDSTVLTVGYQAEKLFEVAGDDNGLNTKIDTLTHGAFIKLGGTF